jgi:hypothetical protein
LHASAATAPRFPAAVTTKASTRVQRTPASNGNHNSLLLKEEHEGRGSELASIKILHHAEDIVLMDECYEIRRIESEGANRQSRNFPIQRYRNGVVGKRLNVTLLEPFSPRVRAMTI